VNQTPDDEELITMTLTPSTSCDELMGSWRGGHMCELPAGHGDEHECHCGAQWS
jgi:hypothetical protein